MVPSTEVIANTDDPATDAANGAGCATMNRHKVTTPRRHRLRSGVSGTRLPRPDEPRRRGEDAPSPPPYDGFLATPLPRPIPERCVTNVDVASPDADPGRVGPSLHVETTRLGRAGRR